METISQLSQLTAVLETKLNQALVSLTRQPISLNLRNSGIVPITDVMERLGSTVKTTAVYIPILGDVTGDIFVLLPELAAMSLADLMIGNPPGTTKIVGEFEASAIKELGNITTGVIVTEIANSLRISMMLTTPNLASDTVSAMIDQVLIEYGETASDLLLIEFPFSVESMGIDGSFLLLFNKETSELLEKRLKTAVHPSKETHG